MSTRSPQEPIAIVGLGGIYPGSRDIKMFRENLAGGKRFFAPAPQRCSLQTDQSAEAGLFGAFLGEPSATLEKYRIPPIYHRTIPSILLWLLQAVDHGLKDAGLQKGDLLENRTDIICGTSLGTERMSRNSVGIDTIRVADTLGKIISSVNGLPAGELSLSEGARDAAMNLSSPTYHDKLYELASTYASQIAIYLRLHGKALALDAADLTSQVALKTAVDNLSSGECDMAIVVCGHLLARPAQSATLVTKGLVDGAARVMNPFSETAKGFLPGEGAGAVILTRLEDARERGIRIRAVIRGIGLTHSPNKGSLNYGLEMEPRIRAMEEAYSHAGCRRDTIQYIEGFGSGLPDEMSAEVESLHHFYGEGESDREIWLGSVKERIGHTFACDGLATLSSVLLCLEERSLLPQLSRNETPLNLSGTPFEFPDHAVPWTSGVQREPRRAAINASSFTGGHAHLIIEEYIPIRPARTGRFRPRGRYGEEALAIISVGARFGDMGSTDEFWECVRTGDDRQRILSEEVLPRQLYFNQNKKELLCSYSEWAAPVGDENSRGVQSTESHQHYSTMDRTQRLALLLTDEALSRCACHSLAGKRTGVVIGANFVLDSTRKTHIRQHMDEILDAIHWQTALSHLSVTGREQVTRRLRDWLDEEYPPITPETLDSQIACGIAAHIANTHGFQGFVTAVQGACASSIAALDIACRGLLNGTYDAVLTGGVEMGVNRFELILCSRMHLLSSGKIRPFDASADGFTIGEGGSFFIIKRLADAVIDGDEIISIIRSIGSSNDATSLIAPDPTGQSLALKRAFRKTDFSPDTVDYLEMHGTGTVKGDTVETESVSRVYGTGTRRSPLYMGSVKALIGHPMSAAGSAGLAKAVLALHNRTIPPASNITQVNPGLTLEGLEWQFAKRVLPWPANSSYPRRAGVNSFGTGGVNYHVIIEEFN